MKLFLGVIETRRIAMIKRSIDKDGKIEMEKIREVVYFQRFRFKYITGKNLRNNPFNFIILTDNIFFFKLKKLFLWVTLRVYYMRRCRH